MLESPFPRLVFFGSRERCWMQTLPSRSALGHSSSRNTPNAHPISNKGAEHNKRYSIGAADRTPTPPPQWDDGAWSGDGSGGPPRHVRKLIAALPEGSQESPISTHATFHFLRTSPPPSPTIIILDNPQKNEKRNTKPETPNLKPQT